MERFSYSKVETYKSCPKKYYNRYILKLKKPKFNRSLYFGTKMHELLEIYHKEEKKIALKIIEDFTTNLSTNDLNSLEELIEECMQIKNVVSDIFIFYRKFYPHYKAKYVELEFSNEFKTNKNIIEFIGFVDAIKEIEKDKYCLIEHKTFGKIKPNEFKRQTNNQLYIYSYFMEQVLKIKIDEFEWNYIRNILPNPPKINKNGELSKTSLSTTPLFLMETEEFKHLIPNKEKDLEILKSNNDKYFSRHLDFLNKEKQNVVIEELKQDIDTIIETTNFYKNFSDRCNFCEYKNLCLVELENGDVETVKTLEFD